MFGVPFEVIPFKASKAGAPHRESNAIMCTLCPIEQSTKSRFPRVEGYTQAIRNKITVDWTSVPSLELQPDRIPPEVEMKGLNVNNMGRLSLSGPGRASDVSLKEFRQGRRLQELVFDLAKVFHSGLFGPTEMHGAEPRSFSSTSTRSSRVI